MLQRVELDGREIYSRDIGLKPGGGWTDIPLGPLASGATRKIVIEVQAIHPRAGEGWAFNSRTSFQFAPSTALPHLAIGKPTAQSSTLTEYPTASPQSAVDGKTGGHFFDGSTTHTGPDPNAWWQVDLLASVPIGDIVIWNRTDPCCSDRLNDYWVFVSNTPFHPSDTPATLKDRPGTWHCHQTTVPRPSTRITTNGAPASTPIACTIIRPPGERRRSTSAIQPPSGEPIMLASCTKMVAVSPAMARLIRSDTSVLISASSTISRAGREADTSRSRPERRLARPTKPAIQPS